MKIESTFALLDVQKGRRKLLSEVGGNGIGKTGQPTGKRIPVTITGFVVGAWGGDDGTSREFQVDVTNVEIQEDAS